MPSFRPHEADNLDDKNRLSRAGAVGVRERARELLSQHPYFCGRADDFEFEWIENVLVVRGRVPTYYLKQLLHSALKKLDGVRQIDNCVDVVRPELQDDDSCS